MKNVDVAVIGGGVLGCFTARNLTRFRLSVILIEAAEDVCTGVTRANTAVVYPGCDNRPGSRKAALTVRANASFDRLCGELDVPFSRCGSLMTAYGPRGETVLQRKLDQGRKNGVPGLQDQLTSSFLPISSSGHLLLARLLLGALARGRS